MLRYYEEKTVKGETVRTEFQWLTTIQITKKNAEKIADTGRKRWKIENEGFNRQKNWQGDITHPYSHNVNAMKNHYLMTQIADMVRLWVVDNSLKIKANVTFSKISGIALEMEIYLSKLNYSGLELT